MGCGVAALAGISCDQIGTAIQVLLLLFGIAVLVVVGYASKREKLLRNESIALAILVSPFVWAHFSGANRLAVIKAQMQEFRSVCYGKAFERIHRRAENLKTLVLSPKSNIMGAWEFELFFGKTRPEKWGGMPVVASPPDIDLVGAYEMSYTYLPEERAILDTPTLFRGVRQEIFTPEIIDTLGNEFFLSQVKDFLAYAAKQRGSIQDRTLFGQVGVAHLIRAHQINGSGTGDNRHSAPLLGTGFAEKQFKFPRTHDV